MFFFNFSTTRVHILCNIMLLRGNNTPEKTCYRKRRICKMTFWNWKVSNLLHLVKKAILEESNLKTILNDKKYNLLIYIFPFVFWKVVGHDSEDVFFLFKRWVNDLLWNHLFLLDHIFVFLEKNSMLLVVEDVNKS